MEQVPRHIRTFKPRYYELDTRGELTPSAMIRLFEETASSHLEETGWNVYRLLEAGFGWILLQGSFTMERYPRYQEQFNIETWVPGCYRFYGLRQFLVRDTQGKIIGTAHSLWIFFDLSRNRPSVPFKEILEVWKPNSNGILRRENLGGVVPELFSDLKADESCFRNAHEVHHFDIDTNGHVNHVRYIDWVLDAIPDELREHYWLRSMSGSYIHEILLGQRVLPYAEILGHDANHFDELAVQLAIYSGSEGSGTAMQNARLAAKAVSTWVPRLG